MKIYPLLSCASARDKLIKVKAYIKTESGSAVIRLRMNGKVLEYTPDTDGRFERAFNFQNGGNYMQLYNDRLRPFHRNSSDDSRICINKNGRNFLQLLPLLYNAIFELL